MQEMLEHVDFVFALRSFQEAFPFLLQIESEKKWMFVPGDDCVFDRFELYEKLNEDNELIVCVIPDNKIIKMVLRPHGAAPYSCLEKELYRVDDWNKFSQTDFEFSKQNAKAKFLRVS